MVVASVIALLLLAGCSREVDVDDAKPVGTAVSACRALVDGLPDKIGGIERRKDNGDFGAAYGDPPIVLRCGVADPDLATDCLDVGGVQWSPEDATGGVILHTIGRSPAVELLVPEDYREDNAWLSDLGPAVAKHTTLAKSC